MSPTDFYNIIKTLPVGQSGFPTKKQMAKATKLNIYNVRLFLKGLVNNGKIRMEGNWYKFNEEFAKGGIASKETIEKLIEGNKQPSPSTIFVTDEQTKEYIDHITEENKHDSVDLLNDLINKTKNMSSEEFAEREKRLGIDKIHFDPKDYLPKNKLESFTILRWIMLTIGIGASIISAYYTQIWQHETLNIFWSWFLSLIMIGFSSAAFLTLIGLITKSIYSKWSTWLMAIVFFILWIICLIYSIQATVAGRFNQYQEIVLNNKVKENSQSINQVKINNLLENINSLKEDKSNNQKQLNVLLNQYDYMQVNMGVKGETFQSINGKISAIKDYLITVNTKLENKNAEYEKMLESGNIINTNESKFGFYDWAAKVYKTDRGNIEWIFLLFPSPFLDIASPIALAVFMFLGRKRE
jgi:hypothetical protein